MNLNIWSDFQNCTSVPLKLRSLSNCSELGAGISESVLYSFSFLILLRVASLSIILKNKSCYCPPLKYVAIYHCLDYFTNVNGTKQHIYYPNAVSKDSSKKSYYLHLCQIPFAINFNFV